jgi:two-component system CheB/CheR fusion protein
VSVPRWSLVDRLGSFLFESSIGVVVVDRNYDISTINQAARSMLGIRGQGIGEDLVHLAEVPSAELKGALDAAFRNESSGSTRELRVPNIATSEIRYLQISCYPDRMLNKDGKVEGVIVLAVDVTASAALLHRLESQNQHFQDDLARLLAQNAELKARQTTLSEANEELTTANADLRSANEHLLISAEEAEAAAEEVETLNEEMQATSEELETLNEELQATVEELNTTNEELAARSNELERSAKEREAELELAKQTLETLRSVVAHTPLVVCLLDRDHTVTVASQEYVALAERNGGVIPAIGEAWKHQGKSFRLGDAHGTQHKVTITRIVLPQDGTHVMLLLTPE